MDQVKLRVAERDDSGSRTARRLRRTGQIPATVYGRGMDARSVIVDSKDLFGVLHTEAGLNALINVAIDGGDELLTVAREIQRHPVRGDITHLDFIRVVLDEAIVADVSLEFIGTPVGVYQDGGFVEAIETTVSVTALPLSIPTSIPYDISELLIGDGVRLGDLPAIEGVEYNDDPDRPILSVLAPRAEEEIEEEVEGEELEGEEGEEVEGEEGAEATDSDEADDSAEE